ncbi:MULTISPECIES: NAD-dependent epimerase/dehydratase family protein [unclassified Pseudomonas]|jgi:nucleoside-diphosphate-sugar epimerase|uniref:NAD-dependent epimerase/dehydratase family protein n=1 Tax=unclassified Pseudomonas TaxID=196821 RepID=UPI0014633792|nr:MULTISPECIES: NAD(P)-dependent oxidoreductase [unclassified Pseudomonas]QJI16855.1 NAD(P)-dependent oxidoreductase [Pseudomonas sp. ADAK21]QJI22983.1 NAD(P)-dependent oxidoreductase [Pseudomonas sp. ADAK20]
MHKKALITGVTGFIGGAVARCLLESGWSVALITRDESDTSQISDILHKSKVYLYDGSGESLITAMHDSKPDVVLHLASLVLVEHQTAKIPSLIASNVLFGSQLLDAMVQAGVKHIVSAGTIWQFFGEDEAQAVNFYAATKQAFEKIIDFYHDAFGVSAISLILADTYGVGDKRPKLINYLIRALGEPEVLNMSPGDQVIDISHVRDVAMSFRLAATKLIESPDPVRMTLAVSGTRLSVKQLVAAVERVAQQTINVQFGGRPYRFREVMCPAQISELESDWKKVELVEGIQELLEASRSAT